MAHSSGGHRHARGLARWGIPAWGLGTAAACGVAAVVAVAVGISQATASPACAAVSFMPAAARPGPVTLLAATGTTAAARPGPATLLAATGTAAHTSTAARPGPATLLAAAAGQTSGEATHYVLQPGTGNCSYPGLPAGQLYVALSPGEYAAGAACGSYLQVSGPDGSVTAEVVDQCPPCGAGHIDLSEPAFARIAPLSAGLVGVSYHTIVDPPLPGPLSVLVKTGSSAYYLALLPVNTGNALASVQASSPSHGWQDLARASYGYWLAPAGLGAGPFTVRLTDSAGHQATLTGIQLSPGTVQVTSTWMYGSGGAAAPPAAPAAGSPADGTPAATAAGRSPAAARKARTARMARHRRKAAGTAAPSPSRHPASGGAAAGALAGSPTPSCYARQTPSG